MSIQFLLILNRQGKTRLSKWFTGAYNKEQRQTAIEDVHRLVSSRDLKAVSNFVEFKGGKLVYRRYAGLYFVMQIDVFDNELIALESMHFLVEILDSYFDNVCELDLVFNFHKLYIIVEEIFLGGETHEMLKDSVLQRLGHLDAISLN